MKRDSSIFSFPVFAVTGLGVAVLVQQLGLNRKKRIQSLHPDRVNVRQTILAIITTINPNKREQLESFLSEIKSKPKNNAYILFHSLPLLHFASFTIIDCQGKSPVLVFENNFDGDLSGYLDQMLHLFGEGLHELYKCCINCPNTYQPSALKSYLVANIVRPNAYHIGNIGRSAKTIADNANLREELQIYLDKLFSQIKADNISTLHLREEMQDFVRSAVDPNLYSLLPPRQTISEKVIPWIRLTIAGVLSIGLLPLVIIALLILRIKEKTDRTDTQPLLPSNIQRLMATENIIAQSHLANFTKIKPGILRLLTLKTVLFAANLLARTSNKGKLGGIPSIHFAHWSIINNEYLLFLSNYDGSWSSYLDDFIDKASRGLTGIWSNTVGFPKTRFLLFDGARDEPAFKAFARNTQVPSQVWYSAYPELTVQNIDRDSSIREDLFTDLSQTDTEKWLNRF
ncbi:hypothetical protein [Hymenobacter seoulensis]